MSDGVYTEHFTASTIFSNVAIFCQSVCLRSVVSSLFHTINACVWLKFFLHSVETLHLARILETFSIHTSCLFLVFRFFHFLFESTTTLDTFSKDGVWNQIKLLCTPPGGWPLLAFWLRRSTSHPGKTTSIWRTT